MTIAPVKFIFATLFSLGGASTTAILYDNTEKSISAERETETEHCVDGFFKNASNICDISSIENQFVVEDFIKLLDDKTDEARAYRSNIAEQWSEQTKHLPVSFFKQYSKNFMVKEPGVCHMKVFDITIDGEKETLYIPFKKTASPLKTPNLWGQKGVKYQKTLAASSDHTNHRSSITGNGLDVTENGDELIAKLTKLAPTSHKAQEALFLFQLYQKTIDRLSELSVAQDVGSSNTSTSNKYLWEYDELMCGGRYKTKKNNTSKQP